jgi:hypothetical protein
MDYEGIMQVSPQLDDTRLFTEQACRVVDSVNLSPAEWQTAALMVNLPGMHISTALVLTEIHGRIGYLPVVLRLNHVPYGVLPQFEVAEIHNL